MVVSRQLKNIYRFWQGFLAVFQKILRLVKYVVSISTQVICKNVKQNGKLIRLRKTAGNQRQTSYAKDPVYEGSCVACEAA